MRHHRQLGFSLLEVLAAFTILIMMVSMVYGILYVSRQTQRSHEKKLARYARIRQGLERIESDLSMAYLSLGEDQMQQEKRTFFRASPDAGGTTLTFSTFSHVRSTRKAKEADNCLVEYSLIDDPDDPGRFLIKRRETYHLDHKPPQDIPGRTLALIPGVTQLTMEFFDKRNNEWVDEWDTTSADGKSTLPNQIKIHLIADNGTGHEVHFHTIVFPKISDPINIVPAAASSGSYMGGTSKGTGSSTKKTTTGSSRSTFRTPGGIK